MPNILRNKPGVLIEAAGVLLSVALMAAIFWNSHQPGTHGDTRGYIEFAESIVSGELFVKKDVSEIEFPRAVRTPGYPLVIVAGGLLFEDKPQGALFMHLIIAALTICFVSMALRPYMPTLLSGLAIVAVEIPMGRYYHMILTEWVAIHLLIGFIAGLVILFKNPSNRNILVFGLVISAAVLLRPAILPAYAFLPLAMIYRRNIDVRGIASIVIALVPLLLWMSFNQYHLGRFSIAALGGNSLYPIGTMIGYAEPEPGDSDDLKRFIIETNEKKMPPPGEEEGFVQSIDSSFFMMRWFVHNMMVGRLIAEDMGYDVITYDRELHGVYGKRAIANFPLRYIAYVAHGMKLGLYRGFPMLVFILLLIPILSLRRKQATFLAYASLAMFGLHIMQLLAVSMVQGIVDRYMDLTFYPFVAAVLLTAIALLLAEFAGSGYYRNAPNWLKSVLANS